MLNKFNASWLSLLLFFLLLILASILFISQQKKSFQSLFGINGHSFPPEHYDSIPSIRNEIVAKQHTQDYQKKRFKNWNNKDVSGYEMKDGTKLVYNSGQLVGIIGKTLTWSEMDRKNINTETILLSHKQDLKDALMLLGQPDARIPKRWAYKLYDGCNLYIHFNKENSAIEKFSLIL